MKKRSCSLVYYRPLRREGVALVEPAARRSMAQRGTGTEVPPSRFLTHPQLREKDIAAKRADDAEKLVKAQAELTCLYNSRSWRITAPLRYMVTLVRGRKRQSRLSLCSEIAGGLCLLPAAVLHYGGILRCLKRALGRSAFLGAVFGDIPALLQRSQTLPVPARILVERGIFAARAIHKAGGVAQALRLVTTRIREKSGWAHRLAEIRRRLALVRTRLPFVRGKGLPLPARTDMLPGLPDGNAAAVARAHALLAGRMPEGRVSVAEYIVDVLVPEGSFEGACTLLLAHTGTGGRVAPFVAHMGRHYKSLGWRVVLISATPLDTAEDFADWADAALYRTCPGQESTSWKCALTRYPSLYQSETLILGSDGVVGPLGSYAALHARMDAVPCDFWGLFESTHIVPHLDTSYRVFRKNAVQHEAFAAFWEAVPATGGGASSDCGSILSLWLALHGLRPGAYLPASQGNTQEVSFWEKHWPALLAHGVPCVPRGVFARLPRSACADALEKALGRAGCPEEVLAVCRPVDAAAAARLPEQFRPAQRQGTDEKIALGQLVLPKAGRPTQAAPVEDAVVDIIIPVYNGKQHLEKLLPSLLAHTDSPHRFIVIDDASPDRDLFPWLEEQLRGREDTVLLQNEMNLGFPATVNRGASLSRNNFVILNTDTVVPAGWLPRLMAPLYRDPTVGSATPFSNAATIFSFPLPDNDALNAHFLEKVGLAAIDTAMQGNALGGTVSAPTGVGFCMAVSRAAWEAGGGFDAYHFENGYGEENDWCQRTARMGWKHVLAPNLYVAHLHGGSFPSDVRTHRRDAAMRTMNALHPSYGQAVGQHCATDPWAGLRHQTILRLLGSCKKVTLYCAHSYGGGAELYLQKKIAEQTAMGEGALVVRYSVLHSIYTLEIITSNMYLECCIADISVMESDSFCAAVSIDRVVLNNLVGWNLCADHNPLSAIRGVAARHRAGVTFLVHDFYAICPTITLLDHKKNYCGCHADTTACGDCEKVYGYDIAAWRKMWQSCIAYCDEVVFFSKSSQRLFSRIFTVPKRARCLIPHEPVFTYKATYTPPACAARLSVAVIGNIGLHKGSGVVSEVAAIFRLIRPDVDIVIIGGADRDPSENLWIVGEYDGQYLPEILAHYNVQVALFPSIWPETFSFVVQELMQIGVPLVCFDIGAPAGRVREYAGGTVVPLGDIPALIRALLALLPPPAPGTEPPSPPCPR